MMKRILIALALVVLPSLAMAGTADRDILLTSDGTLYTIESASSEQLGLDTRSSQVLVLNVRDDSSTTTTYVPETLNGGSHTSPALAYDAVSKTLFVFWQRGINNGMSSDLVFCSYSGGKWSEATSIDSANYHYSHNIRIGVTRRVDQIDENGNHSSVPQLSVHAVWWEEAGGNQWARYAMITIENGLVSDIQIRDLSAFVDASKDAVAPAGTEANELLRHPALFETPAHDIVDVVFGDLTSNNLHRVGIRPTVDFSHAAEGRLRIPVGVKDTNIGTPNFRTGSNAQVAALTGSSGKLVFYTTEKDTLNYVMYDGTWSTMRSLPLTDSVNADTGVEALRRMANSE